MLLLFVFIRPENSGSESLFWLGTLYWFSIVDKTLLQIQCLKKAHLLSHSFCGPGVWAWLICVLCLGFYKAANKVPVRALFWAPPRYWQNLLPCIYRTEDLSSHRQPLLVSSSQHGSLILQGQHENSSLFRKGPVSLLESFAGLGQAHQDTIPFE